MTRYKLKNTQKPVTMPIGTIVKNIRIKKNISLYRLAKETKIAYSTLKSMESSGKSANFDYVVRIAKALNEPLETFTEEGRKLFAEEKKVAI